MRNRLRRSHRRVHLFAIFVIGVCAATSLSAASAEPMLGELTAGKQLANCNPLATASGSDGFSSSGSPPTLGRGGDGIREPDLGQIAEDLPASAKGNGGRGFKATIPVWFHVVTDGAIGNLTSEQIADQIRVLNLTFAGSEGGYNTGFRFTLAGVTRTDNPAWFYAGPNGVDENRMKKMLRRGGAETLNIYSTTAGPYLGWAYLPEIVTKPGQAHLDGIVVDWASWLGTSTEYAGRYDQGETGTHETGHWLNLEHTFSGGCTPHGDFVADTPPERTPTSGCPIGKDTCPEPGLDPIHNYMDYSYDQCYTQFTAGQAQRMQDSYLYFRA
jgi:hypothetical protein